MTTPNDPASLTVTDLSRPRRHHERGHFDKATIHGILDAQPMCHVGYLMPEKYADQPIVMPTVQWREGDHVYWHASSASRGLKAADGAKVCLTVSILDGWVLGRSAMHHSVNYRSVLVFGTPTMITDVEVKEEKLKNMIEHLYPGRWDMLRPITTQELKATSVLSLPLEEASAKIRDAGVIDDEEDYALPIWAGVVPTHLTTGEIQPDPRNLPGVVMPDHVTNL